MIPIVNECFFNYQQNKRSSKNIKCQFKISNESKNLVLHLLFVINWEIILSPLNCIENYQVHHCPYPFDKYKMDPTRLYNNYHLERRRMFDHNRIFCYNQSQKQFVLNDRLYLEELSWPARNKSQKTHGNEERTLKKTYWWEGQSTDC